MSINSYLTNLSSNLIIRDNEKESIARSINTLESRLRVYFRDDIEVQFCFGSYTRGTILPRKADENSDIDYMVVFKNSNRYKPETFFKKLRDFANHWYNRSEIYRDSPTIVLELNHIKFELVPAYNSSYSSWATQYNIPAPRSEYADWIQTDPNGFNSRLTAKNTSEKSLIKPLVRLLKYWNSLNGHIYSSYELEQHIVNNIFYFDSNLRDYFYAAVASLPTYGLSYTNINKVNRFKEKVAEIKRDESNEHPLTAQGKLERLIPNI